jgi:hypothetical protein
MLRCSATEQQQLSHKCLWCQQPLLQAAPTKTAAQGVLQLWQLTCSYRLGVSQPSGHPHEHLARWLKSRLGLFYQKLLLTMPYLIVPHRTVPYCTIPCIVVLYCTVPHRTVPYRTVPYRTVPYRTVSYRIVPHCTALHRTVIYLALSYRTVPYYILY